MTSSRKYFLMIAGICNLLIAQPQAHAISESDFQNQYRTVVQPFFNRVGKVGSIKGERNWTLPYIAFTHPKPRASVAIAGGYNESFCKYDEVAYDLYQQGYSVYILDYRGQGAARHFLKEPRKGYVDLFKNFTTDFKRFVDLVVPNDALVPRLLLAHSLGGAIAAHYLEKYPDDFSAAVLSSPMLSINLGRAEWVANAELHGLREIGQDRQLAPGTTLYNPATQSFDSNIVTHSPARYAKNTQILIDHPEVFVAGQTVHWLIEGIRGSRFARSHGGRAETPILLLQAGADEMVLPEGQNLFCKQAPSCKLNLIDQAKHEILQESDVIRSKAMTEILQFFQLHESAAKNGQ